MATIVRTNTGDAAPFNSVADAIAEAGGVEEEFLFEGTATQYQLAGGSTDYALDGHWAAEPMATQEFRSRMLVLRPADPASFNGTVVVTWNNVSGGQDGFGGPGTARLVEDGFALVGVTTQRVGVDGHGSTELPEEFQGHAVARPPGLKRHDPERYGTLQHPGDGYSYDIFRQAGELLGPDRPRSIDPLGGLEVRHLVATGGSQSATRLATYINAVHPIHPVYDAFLPTIYAGCPNALDPATAPENLPQIPSNNTVELLEWRTYRLREDLGIPIIVLNSEFEAEQCWPNHQPDTDTLRWWEIAGTAHLGLGSPEMIDAMRTALPGACTVSFAPANRAALHALRRWLDGEGAPPNQPRLLKVGEPPAFPRDEHGNAQGGIRWPDVEAPLGTHVGECPPDGYVQLMGHSTPFPPDKVRALYPDHAAWLALYTEAVGRLVEDQVVLPDDAAQMVARAAAQELPV